MGQLTEKFAAEAQAEVVARVAEIVGEKLNQEVVSAEQRVNDISRNLQDAESALNEARAERDAHFAQG